MLNKNQFVARLKQEFHPRQLLPDLAAGLVTGIVAVSVSTAFAALVFSGDLASYISVGVGLMLFGSVVTRPTSSAKKLSHREIPPPISNGQVRNSSATHGRS